jgi:hypothetical protein
LNLDNIIGKRGMFALGAASLGALLGGVRQAEAADGRAPSPYFFHLFTGSDGQSHFDVLDPRQASVKLPYLYKAKATEVSVLTYPAGHRFDWHLTRDIPRLIMMLQGIAVTIVNDAGEPGVSYYPLTTGSLMLAEDKCGRGHRGVIFGDEDAVSMQVDLAVNPTKERQP